MDNEAPVFSNCPTDIAAEAQPGTTETTVSWVAPTATDNVNGIVTPTVNFPSGSIFSGGSTEVVYTATDSQGNTATCSFNVVIIITAPVITFCPDAAQTFSTGGTSAVVNYQTPTATDDGALTVSSTNQPGDTFPVGETVVTYTFTDDEGLFVTCSFSIIVVCKCLHSNLVFRAGWPIKKECTRRKAYFPQYVDAITTCSISE